MCYPLKEAIPETRDGFLFALKQTSLRILSQRLTFEFCSYQTFPVHNLSTTHDFQAANRR
jgi:hypothetical protein